MGNRAGKFIAPADSGSGGLSVALAGGGPGGPNVGLAGGGPGGPNVGLAGGGPGGPSVDLAGGGPGGPSVALAGGGPGGPSVAGLVARGPGGPNPAHAITLQQIEAWSNEIQHKMEPGAAPMRNLDQFLDYLVDKKVELRLRAYKRKRGDEDSGSDGEAEDDDPGDNESSLLASEPGPSTSKSVFRANVTSLTPGNSGPGQKQPNESSNSKKASKNPEKPCDCDSELVGLPVSLGIAGESTNTATDDTVYRTSAVFVPDIGTTRTESEPSTPLRLNSTRLTTDSSAKKSDAKAPAEVKKKSDAKAPAEVKKKSEAKAAEVKKKSDAKAAAEVKKTPPPKTSKPIGRRKKAKRTSDRSDVDVHHDSGK